MRRGEELAPLIKSDISVGDSKKKIGSKGSFFSAYYNLLHTAIGAGVLDMANSFALAGIAEILILEVLLVAIAATTLYILVLAQEKYKTKEYFSLLEASYSKYLRMLAQVMVIVYSFGACVIYLKTLGDQAEPAMLVLLGEHFYTSKWFLIMMCTILIALPLSALPKMEWLEWSSGLGVIAIVTVACMVVVSYFAANAFGNPQFTEPMEPTPMFTPGIGNAIGAIVAMSFAFQCHISANTIYDSMANPTPKTFLRVLLLVLGTCFVVYTAVGLFGSLKFGRGPYGAQSDILLNYDALGHAVAAARILVSIAVATAYPLCLFVGRQGIESFVIECAPSVGESKNKFRLVFVVETLLWVILSCLLAIEVPSIGVVIDYIGNIAALFMFTFPGLMLLKMYDGPTFRRGSHALGNVQEGTLGAEPLGSEPRTPMRYYLGCNPPRLYAYFLILLGIFVAVLGLVRMFVSF